MTSDLEEEPNYLMIMLLYAFRSWLLIQDRDLNLCKYNNKTE